MIEVGVVIAMMLESGRDQLPLRSTDDDEIRFTAYVQKTALLMPAATLVRFCDADVIWMYCGTVRRAMKIFTRRMAER